MGTDMNTQALRSLQRAHDNMEPPVIEEGFLDTRAGQEWLSESANALVNGNDVIWQRCGRRITSGVTFSRLTDKLSEECSDEYQAACDALLRATLRNNDDDCQALEIVKSDLRKIAKAAAIDLLAPLADDYAKLTFESEA